MKPVYSEQTLKSLATAKQEKMTPISDRARLRLFSQRSLLLGIGCLATLGLLSKGMVWAQTEAPQVEITAPQPSEAPPSHSEPTAAVEPEIAPPQEAPELPPITEHPEQPEYVPETPAAAAPEPYLPEPEIAPPTVEAPTAAESNPEPPANSNNAYIDPTDYNVGATNTYEAPTAVQFSERSTGCDAVVGTGQEIAGALCAPPAPQQQTADANTGNPYAENVAAPTARKAWENGQQQPGTSYAQGDSSGSGYAPRSEYASESGYSSNGGATVASIGSIQVGPITVSTMSDSGFSYYNQTPRPPALPG
ncbi:MAG TPA: peptidase M23, partial [Kamptonema sp.]|nr:peptidase M23 [Kamptonema sp.]